MAMTASKRIVLMILAAAAAGCGGNGPADMTKAEVEKTITDENERTMARIRELEKKYGKDHPVVKEERGNLGREK
jgi:ABC-type glycerol-3-phosphate transport system substrate-binding protein